MVVVGDPVMWCIVVIIIMGVQVVMW